MNLPFLFYKSLQKMSSRVKQHEDHTSQSIFHHGLIKLIISTVLQHEGKTWDFFLFWSGFHVKQEEQQPKRQTNKGKVMMKKLGQKDKPANKEEFKVEEVAEQVKLDSKIKRSSVGTTGRYSLFAKEELQPSLQLTPATDSEETKTVVEEEATIPEDEV